MAAYAQYHVQPQEVLELPLQIDSNTPVFWHGGSIKAYSSTGWTSPVLSVLGQEILSEQIRIDTDAHHPLWIESVWHAPDGRLFAWYHHEQVGLCADLNVPAIGALVSHDGGKSFTDLGIVLSSGEPVDCVSQNGYFAGGHGDFSVIPDREGRYFYFLFSAYAGDISQQGVAIARMAAADLEAPAGAVWKYHNGEWSQPGLGGLLTPIFPATVRWQVTDTDSFWGPSIHWNTYLEKYVVLLNRSCCVSGWPQEGIYLTMNSDLSDPAGWSTPAKILEGYDWYPWVLGTGPGESSTEAGKVVRLMLRNYSEWQITFQRDDEFVPDPAVGPPVF